MYYENNIVMFLLSVSKKVIVLHHQNIRDHYTKNRRDKLSLLFCRINRAVSEILLLLQLSSCRLLLPLRKWMLLNNYYILICLSTWRETIMHVVPVTSIIVCDILINDSRYWYWWMYKVYLKVFDSIVTASRKWHYAFIL